MQPIQGERRRRAGQKHRLCAAADTAGVTLFHKGDFEAQLDKTKEVLKAAGVYINSIDAESYETETGYWLVPITVEILKEE